MKKMEHSNDTWLRCPTCGWKLAKLVRKGVYESKNRKGGKNPERIFASTIIVGAITCPNCGHQQQIPPSSPGGTKQIEVKKHA